jgi:two-component system, NarL family, captular synthesis response regulator RcsB
MTSFHGKTRVVPLDDPTVVRRGLEAHFSQSPDIAVIASSERSLGLVASLKTNSAAVLLLDCAPRPDDIDGLNLIRSIATRFPDSRLLIPPVNATPSPIDMSMGVGGHGFVGKSENLHELDQPIRTVAAGKLYLGAALDTQLAVASPKKDPRRLSRTSDPDDAEDSPSDDEGHAQLSDDLSSRPREDEGLRSSLAAAHASDIAAQFARSPKIISTQERCAFRMPLVRSDVELFAARNSLEDS